MPTYEYHCDTCDENFDVVQSFHDEALTECPTCSSPVRKVFGNVGIVFKGSGFYKTDSRSNGKKPTGASDGDGGANGNGKDGKDSGSEKTAADSSSASPSTDAGKGSGGSGGSSNGSSGTSTAPAPRAPAAKPAAAPSSS